LLFRSSPGLRCSTSRIDPGVHIRAEGGYVIWWPREGYAVEDAEVAEWPGWLLEAAKAKPRRGRDLRTSLSEQSVAEHVGDRIAVESIRAALDQLDPCAFEGDRERWIAFMNGAKAIGAPMELFAEWTSRNPAYQRNDDEIERNWHSLRGLHAGAFYAELKAAGIKFTRRRGTPHNPHKGESPEVSLTPSATRSPLKPSLNPRARYIGIRAKLEREAREDLLFWAACEAAEMVAEGWPMVGVAQRMLEQACRDNGLWRALGDEGCRKTIANGFRHVELKLLGEDDDQARS
jgi:hypothetical protein